jgi:anti-sigma regulatory factor (Ser/Thr protein kinase)
MPQRTGTPQPSHMPDGAHRLYECEFTRADLGSIRAALASHASAHGVADQARFNFILAVNELTTNAIVHGGGGGCVRLWHHGDALWCEIVDTGRGLTPAQLDRMRKPDPRQHGHGLWLVKHICGSVHIDTGEHGTRVLLRYPVPAP